jgi:outer membrane phospholipase A
MATGWWSEALYVVGSTNDNPDITKYMGYYRLKVGYQLGDAILSAQGQYNWNTGYGGAELGVRAIRSPATCVSTPGLQRLWRVAHRL